MNERRAQHPFIYVDTQRLNQAVGIKIPHPDAKFRFRQSGGQFKRPVTPGRKGNGRRP